MGTATAFNEDNGLAAAERRYQDGLSQQARLDADYAAEIKRQERELTALVENGDLLAQVLDREPYLIVKEGVFIPRNLCDVLDEVIGATTAPEDVTPPRPIDVWKVIMDAKQLGLKSAKDLLERCVKTSAFQNVDADDYDASYFEDGEY